MNMELPKEQKNPVDSETARQLLAQYGEAKGLRGLEDRVTRGLDPAAMLALPQTRSRIENLTKRYGADIDAVELLIKDLHVGGVWAHAEELAAANSPAVTVWTVAGEATVRDKIVLGDLTSEQFEDDAQRVVRKLDEALDDPQGFAQTAHENLIVKSQDQFSLEDGIPVSEVPEGFLAMAVNGYPGGIIRDTENQLLFVGANKLDFAEVASKHGLVSSVEEDRGRDAQFYVTPETRERQIKQLYPGLGIVVNGDMALAKELASTATRPETPSDPLT